MKPSAILSTVVYVAVIAQGHKVKMCRQDHLQDCQMVDVGAGCSELHMSGVAILIAFAHAIIQRRGVATRVGPEA